MRRPPYCPSICNYCIRHVRFNHRIRIKWCEIQTENERREMKKKLKKTVALAAGMLCLAGVTSALAGDAEVEQLTKQMQQLVQQNH